MNRLKDEGGADDPLLAEAAKLALSVHIAEAPRGLEQRLRAELLWPARRSSAWRLRPALAALLLFGLITAAGATAVHYWRRQPARVDKAVAPPTSNPTKALKEAPRVVAEVPSATPAQLPALPAKRPAPSAKTSAPLSTQPRPTPPRELPPPSEPEVSAPLVAASTPPRREPEAESLLVLNATRALQREHAPARALSLLEEYLRRFPDGDLLEESLALAIEAKSMQNDRGALAFARTYLQRFPAGRFREQALRAERRFAP
jgi:hypothetical protein